MIKQRNPILSIEISNLDLTPAPNKLQVTIQDCSLKPVKTNPSISILKKKTRAISVRNSPKLFYPLVKLRSHSKSPELHQPINPLNFRFSKLDEIRKKIVSKLSINISKSPQKTPEKRMENFNCAEVSPKNTDRTSVLERFNQRSPFKSIVYIKGYPKLYNRIILS